MQRVRRSTAVAALPSPPAGSTPGFFANPALGSGVPATVPGYEWYNSVQEEIAAPIEASGITLDGTKYNQLYQAIKRIFIKTQTLTDAGTANTYTAANSPALVLNDIKPGLTQQVQITNANTGASTYSPDGLRADPIYGLGLQALQGGELVAGATAILMSATIAGVNGGYPIWVLLECMGGRQQVPAAVSSQHAVQLAQLTGLAGSARNLRMYLSAANASATFTADEVIVETALGGNQFKIAGVNKTINLATVGLGGMDTGAAPNNGFVAIYAAYNPTTGQSGVFGTNATASAAGHVYGGANAPAGYVATGLIAVLPTNATGQIKPCLVRDRSVSLQSTAVLSGAGAVGAYTLLSIAGAVPLNAVSVSGSHSYGSTSASNLAVSIASDANGICFSYSNVSGSGGSGAGSGGVFNIQLVTAQTLYYLFSSTAGTPTLAIYATGYTI